MSVALVWFRQDLRCNDNPAFAAAYNHHAHVIPLYIQDEQTLKLGGAQHWWLHHSLLALEKKLLHLGLRLILRSGDALEVLSQLIAQHHIEAVYWNRCYEPASIHRDQTIKATLRQQGTRVISSNGSLMNEPWAIKNKSGGFFKVFTPYWRHCLQQQVTSQPILLHNTPSTPEILSNELKDWNLLPKRINWAAEFGSHWQPGEDGAQKKLHYFISHHLKHYKTSRDIPAQDATSKLSPHLHFGELSPWHVWRTIQLAMLDKDCDVASAERFLSEIGWREFSYHLLYHVPTLPEANFKTQFDAFPWKEDPALLKSWQNGCTGYPIVDAGMRELWATGYMHNRVRMITASFLTKDLLIDWRHGAAWFLDTLVDADLASNSASWQWVSGCGADAAPYFRIFNPVLQGEKFDPQGEYIRRWVPELQKVPHRWIHQPWAAPNNELGLLLGKDYPMPIVDHNKARSLALLHYQTIKKDPS